MQTVFALLLESGANSVLTLITMTKMTLNECMEMASQINFNMDHPYIVLCGPDAPPVTASAR